MSSKRSEEIIKDSIVSSGGAYLSYVFKPISSIVIRRFLTPASMGLLSELMLVLQFGKFHHLGILDSLQREIPFYRGKVDSEKVTEIKNTGLTFCLLTAFIVVACLLLTAGYLNYIKFDREFIGGLFLVSALIAVELIVAYYEVLLRTHNKFYLLAKFNVFSSFIEMAGTIILIILFGLKGVLLALILAGAIGSYYLFRSSGFRLKINFRPRLQEIIRLLKIGFPLEIYSFVRRSFLNLDKFMIIFLLGRTELGLYSIGVMVYDFLSLLPRSVYGVIYPKFLEDYGRVEDINRVEDYLIKPTVIFAYSFPIIIGAVIISLPLLIKYILPQYKLGLFPANLLILSTFFYSLGSMWGYLLIALYKQIRKVQFNVMAIVIGLFLNYLFAKIFKLGLMGIALATLLTFFILTTTTISYVFSFYTKKLREHLSLFLKLYLPFVWIVFVLFLLRPLFEYDNQSLMTNLLYCTFSMSILTLSCLPLLYFANRKTGILNLTLKVIKAKVAGFNGARVKARIDEEEGF